MNPDTVVTLTILLAIFLILLYLDLIDNDQYFK